MAGVFISALAAGCASLFPQTSELGKSGLPPGLPERVELAHTPFFPQEEYQCGPAALATALVSAGAQTTPEALVPQVYVPERKGSFQVEMLAAARRHGMVSYALAPKFEDLLRGWPRNNERTGVEGEADRSAVHVGIMDRWLGNR